MLRASKNRKGQVISVEYIVIFSLIIAMMTAMTIYFRRLIQARIRDAGYGMADIVQARTAGYGVNVIYRQYDPYYMNTATLISRDEFSNTKILPGKTSGIFSKQIDDSTSVSVFSQTAPPKDADCPTCL